MFGANDLNDWSLNLIREKYEFTLSRSRGVSGVADSRNMIDLDKAAKAII